MISYLKWLWRLWFPKEPEHVGWETASPKQTMDEVPDDFVHEQQEALEHEPVPTFEEVWDSMVANKQLTGIGADIDTEWEDWVFPELEDEALERIMKHLEEDSGEIRKR